MPEDIDEPTVNEVTLASEQPVLSVILFGTVPQAHHSANCSSLGDKLESYRQIAESTIAGDRDDIVEIIVDPAG
ncbi:hypothetical protein O9929_08040 [Vibrio lentus]|nr:hypothetical protein [Vibrio lentus]